MWMFLNDFNLLNKLKFIMNMWILLRDITKRCPKCKFGYIVKKIRISNVNIRNICFNCVTGFYKTNIKTLYNIPLFNSDYLKWILSMKYSIKYIYNGDNCYKCIMDYTHTKKTCLKYDYIVKPIIDSYIYTQRKSLINELLTIKYFVDFVINIITIKELAFIVLEFYF